MEKQDYKQKLLEILLKDIQDAEDVKILSSFFSCVKDYKTYTYTLPILEVRIASLLYTSPREINLLYQLQLDKQVLQNAEELITHMFKKIEASETSIFQLLETFKEEQIKNLFTLKRAYALHKNQIEEIYTIDLIEEYALSFIQNKKHWKERKLDLDPEDLKCIGFKEEEISFVLKHLLGLVQKRRIQNQREILLNYAYHLIGEEKN